MCIVAWMAVNVSHQVRFCQRGGTDRPAFGPLLITPLAQGDGVVFIFSTASVSRAFCSVVAALIERRVPAGGGGGGGGGVGGGGDGGCDGGGGGGDGDMHPLHWRTSWSCSLNSMRTAVSRVSSFAL